MQSPRPAASRLTTPLDLGLMFLLAATAGVETWLTGGDRAGLRTALAVLTVVPIAGRRRAPALSALLIAVGLVVESVATESPDEAGVFLAIILSGFSVAAYAGTREASLGLALLSMSIALSITVDPSDDISNILPTLLLFVAVPAGLGFAFHKRGQDLAALELRADAAERDAAAAIGNERQRLAHELHDVVSHAVTLIAVQAEAGRSLLDADPEGTRRSLSAISAASRDAVSELHSLLALLNEPSQARVDSGLADLPALVAGARAAGLHVSINQSPTRPALEPELDHCAYRIVQEGLTNALRHARDPQVRVTLDHGPTVLEIRIDSTGITHQSTYGGTGRGLAGLRERLAGLGGTLDTSPGDGTFSLVAYLPLESA